MIALNKVIGSKLKNCDKIVLNMRFCFHMTKIQLKIVYDKFELK